MKIIYTLILIAISSITAYGQQKTDTTQQVFTLIERVAEFKGGLKAFGRYISDNLKYPEVAKLLGVDAILKIQFVVGEDGLLYDITPLNKIGSDCEAAAITLLKNSPKWIPGIQNSKPVRIQYTIPMRFNTQKSVISISELRASDYTFLFLINNKEYNLDGAAEKLGKVFPSSDIIIAEPLNDDKYAANGKKGAYLVKIKS
jgi:periplasmic protein TonB